MKILILHNRYQQAGGEDSAVDAECRLLEEYGHEVQSIMLSNNEIKNQFDILKAGMQGIYSITSFKRVMNFLKGFRPDVVHVHNFFPLLSPSVYDACHEYGVPVVQTLHNYRIMCPNGLFLRDGVACEDCLGLTVPWPGIQHGCYRGSKLQTAGVGAMLAFHKIRGTWRQRVDAFIALTEFQKMKLIQSGVPESRIHSKPNFTFPITLNKRESIGKNLLYVGRLSEEKGCEQLLEAYIRSNLRVPLHLVGDGPLRQSLESRADEAGVGANVRFLGWQDRTAVMTEIQEARLMVVPSICYEGFPLTIAEAFSAGLPVLASRTGGIPEIVVEGNTGWLTPPGDIGNLASILSIIWDDDLELIRRGRLAQEAFELYYSPAANHTRLMEIYNVVRGA